MMEHLPAKVIMSRFWGVGTGVHISINDERSGCRLLELWLTLEEFGKAVTASFGNAEMTYYPNCPIGKQREYKQEEIIWDFSNKDSDQMEKALHLHEVDGWKADRADMTNPRNSVGKCKQRVGFRRYVDVPQGHKTAVPCDAFSISIMK